MDKKFLPEWTQPPLMLGTHQREMQRVIGRNAEGKEVSVPHLPYQWWVDNAGNVVPLVISTNRDLKQMSHTYRFAIVDERRRAGWFEYEDTPECKAEIERRQKAHAENSSQFAHAFESSERRMTDSVEKVLEKVAEKLGEVAAKNPKAK